MRSFLVVGLGPAGVHLLYELFRQRYAVARDVPLRAIAIAESESFPLRTNPQVQEAHLATEAGDWLPLERRAAVRDRWRSDLELYLEPVRLADPEPPDTVMILGDPSNKELVALPAVLDLLRAKLPGGAKYLGVFSRPAGLAEPAHAVQLAANLALAGSELDQVLLYPGGTDAGYQPIAHVFLETWLDEPLARPDKWQAAAVTSVTQDEDSLDRLSLASRLRRHPTASPADAAARAANLERLVPAGPGAGPPIQQVVVNGTAVAGQFPDWQPRSSMMVGLANGYLVLSRAFPTAAGAVGLDLPEVREPAAAAAPGEPLTEVPAPAAPGETPAGPPPPEPAAAAPEPAPAAPEPAAAAAQPTPAAAEPAPAAPGPTRAAARPAPAAAQPAPAPPEPTPAPVPGPPEAGAAEEPDGMRTAILAALFGIDPLEYADESVAQWSAGVLPALAAEERLQELVALGDWVRQERLLRGAAAGALERLTDEAEALVPADERPLFDRLVSAMAQAVGTAGDDFTAPGGALGRRIAGGHRPAPPPEASAP